MKMNEIVTFIVSNMLKISIVSLLVIIFLVSGSIYFTRYRSAFEADQTCHSLKGKAYGESEQYGCDHDLETRQWILYEAVQGHQPAKVLKRFRY